MRPHTQTRTAWSRLSLALCLASIAGCGARAPESGPQPGGAEADEVSIGYATADRRDIIHPVASLGSEGIERSHVQRVEELLRRISGVMVTRLPSGDYSVRVRGAGSSTSSNEPLYIIDGVATLGHGLQRITADEVERIDVLKGPAATIYGLRGANGVIVVTTKRGR